MWGNPSFFMACKGRHTPLGFKIQKEEIQMRNLKRALSLALAAIMLVGMMVVSASAASYNDLTDKDQIVNKDAVSMLVSLGIIEGKPDGSYGPTENVDRAQMAKMLSVIMNKGVDNSALYQSVNSGLTDITSHWAKGHINYCYTTGIIAGRGNGTFDPSATVTALEAAKMLLVAVGYDPKIEGFEGADWAINVSVRADEQGIFEGFTKDLSAPLNRDDAALLIYNALDVEMIQSYTTNNYPIAYSDHRTILADKYGVIKVQGVVVANEWASLASDDGDAALKEGKTILLEGQLGSMKDPDLGIFPMTTSSHTLAGFGTVGGAVPPTALTDIITVTKAYSSAVGAGAFVSELFGAEADELRRRGGDAGEFGATTGRPRRVGWFDAVATKYGCMVQGATQVALTAIDCLGYLDEIKVCTGYEIDGKVTTDFPVPALLDRAKPVYETLPGWKCDIRGVTDYGKLPQAARDYVDFIEKHIEAPITIVSTGPKRHEICRRTGS